jgi:hypothetical protein
METKEEIKREKLRALAHELTKKKPVIGICFCERCGMEYDDR